MRTGVSTQIIGNLDLIRSALSTNENQYERNLVDRLLIGIDIDNFSL